MRSKFCENSPPETKKKSLIWFLLWTIATLKISKCLFLILEISPAAYVFQFCDIENLEKRKRKNSFKEKRKTVELKKNNSKIFPICFFYQRSNKICRKNKHCSRVNPQSSVFKINVTKSDDKWQSAAAAISGLNL